MNHGVNLILRKNSAELFGIADIQLIEADGFSGDLSDTLHRDG